MEKENKQAVADLQKALDNWKDKFGGKSPEVIAQELAQANQNKDKLNGWQTKFPSKTAEQVEKELNDLKSKPTVSPLTGEQQHKLDDYDRLKRQKEAALKKAQESMTSLEYEAYIEINNNIN